jgi:two-component system NtrC family response regulator
MARVLVIDDDQLVCETFANVIGRMGHEVDCAHTLDRGIKKAEKGDYAVALLDVYMPDGDGLEGLNALRKLPLPPEVIIITGYGDPDGAELAIRNGAWDYIAKASSHKKVMLSLSRAIRYHEDKLQKENAVALKTEGIIGGSTAVSGCFDELAKAAVTEANVLITGQTGTGKELFARAIHQNSSRQKNRFVVVDCAALPETLTESVLFGHEKGAFTGAIKDRAGLVMQAHKGTLFLDEIGELPLNLQKSFLRVLETRKFLPLGGQRELFSDFRLLAATNRDLDKMVLKKEFREDLLFRLRSLNLHIPRLKDHPSDIRELTTYYLTRICDKAQMACKGFSHDFMAMLMAYPWPGNVRELIHALETACAAAGSDNILLPWHLPTNIRVQAARDSIKGESSDQESGSQPVRELEVLPDWRNYRNQMESNYLRDLMSLSDWDANQAAEVSGMSRSHLYQLLKKHGISKKIGP